MDDLSFAKLSPLNDEYMHRVETLVMGYSNPPVMPAYANDWDDTEKLIARLGELGVGVRIEYVSKDQGEAYRAYLDWQDEISCEWQTVEIEEESAPRAVTRAALLWYYTAAMTSANAAPPDAWAYFEVMERIGLSRDFFMRSLEDHPVLQKESALNALYQEAQDKLAALFELSAQMMDRQVQGAGWPPKGAMH